MAVLRVLLQCLLTLVLCVQSNHAMLANDKNPEPPPDFMTQERFKELAGQIDALTKSQDLNDYEAFDRLGKEIASLEIAAKSVDAEQFKKDRAMKTRLLLRTLACIQKRIDPHFTAKDSPSINVSPPAATRFPAGIDPIEIKDPKLRKQYEEAIHKNDDKIKVHNLQTRLRRLRDEWPNQRLYDFARDSFDQKNKQDRDEWQKLIDEELKDKALQKQLHETFAKLDKDYVVAPGGFRIGKPTGPGPAKPKKP